MVDGGSVGVAVGVGAVPDAVGSGVEVTPEPPRQRPGSAACGSAVGDCPCAARWRRDGDVRPLLRFGADVVVPAQPAANSAARPISTEPRLSLFVWRS